MCIDARPLFVSPRAHRRRVPDRDPVLAGQEMGDGARIHRRSPSPQHLLENVGPAYVRSAGRQGRDAGGERLSESIRRPLHPAFRFRFLAWRESVRISFMVNRPTNEPGFELVRSRRPGRVERYTARTYSLDKPQAALLVSAAGERGERGARRRQDRSRRPFRAIGRRPGPSTTRPRFDRP